MRAHASALSCAQLIRMQSMPCCSSCATRVKSSGGFARHRHHDGHAAPGGTRTEHGLGVQVEQPPARRLVHFVWAVRFLGAPAAGQGPSTERTFSTAGQDVRLGTAERRQPGGGETRLHGTKIAASKGEVVEEVSRARLVLRMHVAEQVGGLLDHPQHVVADALELADQPAELVPGSLTHDQSPAVAHPCRVKQAAYRHAAA